MNAKTEAQKQREARIEQIVHKGSDLQHAVAMKLYNAHYNNHLYEQATRNLSNDAANRLIDLALALCGSPYYKITRETLNYLSQAQLDFLAAFSDLVKLR